MMIIDLDLDLVAKWTMKKCRLYCQAQAQVRLSLRLTQALSGSLWLLLRDFDSVT